MKLLITALFSALILTAGTVQAASIGLAEWGVNVDGNFANATSGDVLPPGVVAGGLDPLSGLGLIQISVTGSGLHNVIAYFDHEIDEPDNTYYNEVGFVHGTAAPKQSWQLDNPFDPGTIYGNLIIGALDNTNHSTSPEDVSMAIGWEFDLLADQTALLSFNITDLFAPGGFYLEQNDPDSKASIYFSSTLEVWDDKQSVPEPSTLLLLGAGLVGLASRRRIRRNC